MITQIEQKVKSCLTRPTVWIACLLLQLGTTWLISYSLSLLSSCSSKLLPKVWSQITQYPVALFKIPLGPFSLINGWESTFEKDSNNTEKILKQSRTNPWVDGFMNPACFAHWRMVTDYIKLLTNPIGRPQYTCLSPCELGPRHHQNPPTNLSGGQQVAFALIILLLISWSVYLQV